MAKQAPPRVIKPPKMAAGAGAFKATIASKTMAITMSRFHTKVLMAGVVPVKDLYHMACVRSEKAPRQNASSHVHPKRGKRRPHLRRLIGTRANTDHELCTTTAALRGEADK